MYFADDDHKVLDVVKEHGVTKPTQWTIKDISESKMYSDFPRDLFDKMGKLPLQYHWHTYAVSSKTFNKYPKLF